ncbi:MAG TPA: hypothetical protein VK603_06505 [Candidatus Saccharimonadales bacterium]|nr:hypothetical protein [Candidatus Saccharimonadales bacterium]
MTTKSEANPVLTAIRMNKGLAARIGDECGIGRTAVWMWKRVPADHALTVAKLLRISRHRVRPDLYPAPQRKRRA